MDPKGELIAILMIESQRGIKNLPKIPGVVTMAMFSDPDGNAIGMIKG